MFRQHRVEKKRKKCLNNIEEKQVLESKTRIESNLEVRK